MFFQSLFGTKTNELIGSLVVLRPPRWRDYDKWHRVRLQSADVLRAREPQWPADALSRRHYRRYVREYRLAARYDLGFGFFVWKHASNELMGAVHLSQIRRGAAQMGTLGYWLGTEYHGQGYMQEAVGLVCDFGFEKLGLNRIEAACMLDNVASQRVLTANGFGHEGRAKNYLQINGHWHDHELFGLSREGERHEN